MRHIAYIAIALLILATPLMADWPQGGTQVAGMMADEVGHDVVPDGFGGAVFVWVEGGAAPVIRAQRLDRMGNEIWMSGGAVVTPAGSDPAIPSTVADGQGGVIVAWQERSVSPYEVRIQWLDPDGNFKWAMDGVPMCATTVMEQSGPVLVRSTNRAFVVYQQKNPVPSNTLDLYAQSFDTTGARLWSDYGAAICTTVVGDNKNPAAVPRGDSSLIVAWEDYRNGNGDIYVNTLVNGVPQTTNGLVVCDLAGNQLKPVMARDDSGGAVMAWQDYRSGNSDVYAQRYSGGIMAWVPVGGIPVCTLAGDQHELDVIKAGPNRTMLCWTDLRGGAGSDNIYGMVLNSNGAQHWPEADGKLICGAANEQQAPKIIGHANGTDFIITWQDGRNGDWDVYAQKVLVDGAPGWGGFVCQEGVSDSRNPRITFGSPEHAYFSWIDNRNGNWDIYGQRANWDQFYIGSACAPEPAGPANMGVIGTDQVTFHWHPSPVPPGAEAYRLYVEDAGNPAINFGASPTDTFAQLTLPAGQSYLWRVRAVNGSVPDSSGWSEEWTFSIDTSVPSTPALLAPPNGSFSYHACIEFDWAYDSSAAMHRIQIDDDINFGSPAVDDSMIGWPPYGYDFTFNALGINYYWRVRAGSAAHVWSAWSGTWAVFVDTVDANPPRLTVLANAQEMVLGQQFVFECYAKDEDTLTAVRLVYGTAGFGTNTDVAMSRAPGSDSLWRYTIPANHINARGVQYRVMARDSNNATGYPADTVNFYVHAVSFPGGAYSTTFALDQWMALSVPGEYVGVSLFDMLADDLGPYDATKWRLFDYQNTTLVEQGTGGSGGIHTGQAMWLRQRIGSTTVLDFQNVNKSFGDRLRTQPAPVTLVPGWSDVGSPLAFDVSWDTTLALSDTASVAGPYHFNGTGWLLPNQVISGTITPFAGYAFRNDRASNAILRVPYLAAWKGKGDGRALWPEGWQARVTARSDGTHDDSYFGIGAGTSEGLDRWDFPQPPSGHLPASGYFLLEGDRCAVDLRPELGPGQVWDYELAAGGPVSLEFGLSPGMPGEASVWLLDPVRQSSFQITEGFVYQYSPEPGETSRRFRLAAGGQEFVRAALAGGFGVPAATLMEHGRPNPFNQATTINYQLAAGGPVRLAVYNVAGQLVRTLVDRTQLPGRYGVRWDGRDDRGRSLANGVYLVRMTAGGSSSSQRMTLVR